jgi:hypothetical protein
MNLTDTAFSVCTQIGFVGNRLILPLCILKMLVPTLDVDPIPLASLCIRPSGIGISFRDLHNFHPFIVVCIRVNCNPGSSRQSSKVDVLFQVDVGGLGRAGTTVQEAGVTVDFRVPPGATFSRWRRGPGKHQRLIIRFVLRKHRCKSFRACDGPHHRNRSSIVNGAITQPH